MSAKFDPIFQPHIRHVVIETIIDRAPVQLKNELWDSIQLNPNLPN